MQSLWTLLCQIWSSRTSHEATFTKGTEGATNCSIRPGNHSTVAGPIAQWALLTNYSAVVGCRTSSFLNTETGFKPPPQPVIISIFLWKNNTKQALHRNEKCYTPLNQPQKLQYCSKRQHHIIPKLWIPGSNPCPGLLRVISIFLMKNRLYLTKYQSQRRKKNQILFFSKYTFFISPFS